MGRVNCRQRGRLIDAIHYLAEQPDSFSPANVAQLCLECIAKIDADLVAKKVNLLPADLAWTSGLALSSAQIDLGLRLCVDFLEDGEGEPNADHCRATSPDPRAGLLQVQERAKRARLLQARGLARSGDRNPRMVTCHRNLIPVLNKRNDFSCRRKKLTNLIAALSINGGYVF
jgi:hypothetical protein